MLDAEQKDKIVRLSVSLDEAADEDVITQGDIGETFYLLESGEVDVHKKKADSEEIKVHTYKSGDAFGSLPLCTMPSRCHMPRGQGWRSQVVGFGQSVFQGDRGGCRHAQA